MVGEFHRKMKVLFTTDTLSRGGKERQLTLLASSLNLKGFCAQVYALEFNVNNHYLDEYNLSHEAITVSNDKGYWSGFWEFKAFIKNNHFDIVMSWDVKTAFWCLLLSPFFQYRFINGTIRHGLRKFKLSHFFRSWVAQLSPFVIANSLEGLKTNKIRFKKGKTFVVYNGLKMSTITGNKEEMKRSNIAPFFNGELDPDAKIFLSVANLLPYKDHMTVIEVMKDLSENFPFYFLIVGEGSMRQKLQTRIDELDLQERIKLVGRTSHVRELMGSADVFIHSSMSEGCSNAIIEAMSAGLPVIATGVGGTPEIIFDKTCHLFTLGNRSELLSLLKKSEYLMHESYRHRQAYTDHCSQFNEHRMIEEFCGIFAQCLGQSIKP